ncbi:hypothetical protein HYY73_01995 [Candidatus Woesearchaeota archaeon]|nr:hypothetical protein [Candidatus Woesearchaeota archaeon]
MVKNPRDALILKRLDEIEESVNLGTLDTTIFGLMIFVFATALALVSIGFPKLIVNNPYVFVGSLVTLILIIPLIQYIFYYVETIFLKEGRFTKKKWIITVLTGEVFFIIEIWLFLFAASIYEKWWKIPQWLIVTITLILVLIAILVSLVYIKPRIDKYFNTNFKALLERRERELRLLKQN